MTDLANPSPLSSFSSYRRKQALASIADELQRRSSPAIPVATPVDLAEPIGMTEIVHQLTASADPLAVFAQLAGLLVPTMCAEATAAVHIDEVAARPQLQPVAIDIPSSRTQSGRGGWVLTVATPAHRIDFDGEPVGQQYVAVLTCRGSGQGPTGQEVALIELAARYAAAVVHQARQQQLLATRQQQVANLRIALESNRMISAAIGVLMVTHQLTYQQAFDLLSSTSQTTNRRLATVADTVLQTGGLPFAP